MSSINGQIALQAGVDVQTRHDLLDVEQRQRATSDNYLIFPGKGATSNKDIIRVNENELVFRVTTGKNNFGSGMDNAIPVTSNLNGYCVLRSKSGNAKIARNEEVEESEMLFALAKDIRFVGQALQTTDPMSHEGKRLHCTALIHGTTSVFHNGDDMLHVGDTLYWTLPTSSEINSNRYKTINNRYGIHPEKVTLKTTKAERLFDDYRMHALKVIHNANTIDDVQENCFADKFVIELFKLIKNNATNSNSPRAVLKPDSLGPIFEVMAEMFLETKRREIGKVLKGGRPGTLVDVLLGSS